MLCRCPVSEGNRPCGSLSLKKVPTPDASLLQSSYPEMGHELCPSLCKSSSSCPGEEKHEAEKGTFSPDGRGLPRPQPSLTHGKEIRDLCTETAHQPAG